MSRHRQAGDGESGFWRWSCRLPSQLSGLRHQSRSRRRPSQRSKPEPINLPCRRHELHRGPQPPRSRRGCFQRCRKLVMYRTSNHHRLSLNQPELRQSEYAGWDLQNNSWPPEATGQHSSRDLRPRSRSVDGAKRRPFERYLRCSTTEC
ncbi:unnamed protein product [Lampetra planeri]